jgi:hypothetical protein
MNVATAVKDHGQLLPCRQSNTLARIAKKSPAKPQPKVRLLDPPPPILARVSLVKGIAGACDPALGCEVLRFVFTVPNC